MDTNLFDINDNMEEENLDGSGGNPTSISDDISLESNPSKSLVDEIEGDMQERSTTDESVLPEPTGNSNVHEIEDVTKSKFFAIRITGGQERVVANIFHTKITTKKLKIF